MDMAYKKGILLIGGEEEIYSMLARKLAWWGFNVHVETSGDGALSFASANHVDLIIIEAQLSLFDSVELCRQFRKLFGRWESAILMLTYTDKPGDHLRFLACGADACLAKPYTPAELLETIIQLLGELVTV